MSQFQHRALYVGEGRKFVSDRRRDTVVETNLESNKNLTGRGGFLVHPQSNVGQVGKKDLPPPHCISAQGTALSAGGSLAGARSCAKRDSFPQPSLGDMENK